MRFPKTADGIDELTELAEVAGQQSWILADTLDRVRQVRNDVLRARLLVEEAKGMSEASKDHA